MKIAVVTAVEREMYHGFYTPQRFWADSPKAVEVVDADEDPIDPKTGRPYPEKMGRKTLEQVQASNGFLLCSIHFADSLDDVKIDPKTGTVGVTESERIRELEDDRARVIAQRDAEMSAIKAKLMESGIDFDELMSDGVKTNDGAPPEPPKAHAKPHGKSHK